jgi:hypothetical protein
MDGGSRAADWLAVVVRGVVWPAVAASVIVTASGAPRRSTLAVRSLVVGLQVAATGITVTGARYGRGRRAASDVVTAEAAVVGRT